MDGFTHEAAGPSTPSTARHPPPMRALNINPPPPQETFYDDATPIDPSYRGLNEPDSDHSRHSHDLSFAEGSAVRDSVVDNMLLSLDQFSTDMAGSPGFPSQSYGKPDFFLKGGSYRAPGSRHRGHTYTSSHSSDYDLHPEDSPSRYGALHSRARRSNSSNNIGVSVSRKSSVRDAYPPRQSSVFYPPSQQPGHVRGGAGKRSSKGSGSSSMDFGQAGVLGNQRLGFGKRSASFEHSRSGDRLRGVTPQVEPLLDRGRMAYQTYPDDYDAAPEPTIPAGPRRIRDPPQSPLLYPPQPTHAPPQTPATRRRGSVRSNNSHRTLRKNKSALEPNMRAQAEEFVNASTLHVQPILPMQTTAAPAPNVATRKGYQPPQAPAPAPKEKQGFFRRVFGGGSSKSQVQPSQSSTTLSSSQADTVITSRSQPADVASTHSHTRPRTTPNDGPQMSHSTRSLPKSQGGSSQKEAQQPAHPPLVKKGSSFFRRRKKSFTDNTSKLPIMALDYTPPPKPMSPTQLSPGVSSLREAMDPYLGDITRKNEHYQSTQEYQRYEVGPKDETSPGFTPGYKPHKDSTVRAIQPGLQQNENNTLARSSQRQPLPFMETESPKMRLKVKRGKADPSSPQDDTFLADSSSANEERSGADETRRPSTCPTSPSLHHAIMDGKSDQKAQMLGPGTAATADSVAAAPPAADGDEDWVLTQPNRKTEPPTSTLSPSAKRVWLDTTMDDTPRKSGSELHLPLEGARSSQLSLDKPSPTSVGPVSPSSPNDVFHSATSLPIVQVESRESASMPSIVEDRSTHNEPTDSERQRAFQIFTGDDSSIQKANAAAVLGDVSLSSTRTRKAFMDLFDWTGFNILAAMRDLCGKIVLKAETQQVDRILMSLSERWCECNANHGFKAIDVVHTICYSILLLNTDLHLADIESRMTRSQFVRNTLPTVTRVCQDAIKAAGGDTLRPQSTQFRRGSLPWNDKSEPTSPKLESATLSIEANEDGQESRRARSRLSIKPPARGGFDGSMGIDSSMSDSNLLVNAPYNGPMRGWEFQVDSVLKEFYDAIRKQRLPLHGASDHTVQHQPSSNNLSVAGMLRRTPSVLSKTPSENASFRSRPQTDFRSVGGRWASKNRSRQKLYPSSTIGSSRTSLDDQSVWSPTGSSTWSRQSFGKTGTSMSMDSLGTHFGQGDYQQAIGFASALSQAIIREEGMTIASDEEFTRVAPLLEDETLELAGAPWAKEGMLKHKRHLEAVGKKAKDRAWSECFAVVEKGYMRLFSFSANSKSLRHRNKLRPSAGSVVGGGNWMDNAESLDSFPLRQTIASALPPPGYSKSRPHVFALSLPTGAVHLFQVGTPDIVREFVCTANYWSARLSKEPLTGGVSSMEYGWGENVINQALIRRDSTPSVKGHMPHPSVTSSLRSSVDHATGTPKAKLPGDKVALSDWSPPTSSMMASTLMEVDQLRALTDYVKNVEGDLAHHNELRAPMLIAFSPRHPNATKAMANWERKSQYLLREIVKFRTYIDTLTTAQAQKEKIYAEREARDAEEAAAAAAATDGAVNTAGAGAGLAATQAEEDGAKSNPDPKHLSASSSTTPTIAPTSSALKPNDTVPV